MVIGLDINQDTPTEILHTVLLGVVKYFWGQTVWLLEEKKQLNLLKSRLASLDAAGLKNPDLRSDYIVQY